MEQAQFENPEPYRILYRDKNMLSLMHDETYDQIEMDEEAIVRDRAGSNSGLSSLIRW